MFVKATKQIIDWDAEAGASIILNVGDTATLSDAMLERYKGSYEPAEQPSLADMCAQIVAELDAGDPNGEPEPLAITDDERAALPQLDHDGDGAPGGSVAPADPKEELDALRARYKQLAGKGFFPGWDAATLRAKIAVMEQDAMNAALKEALDHGVIVGVADSTAQILAESDAEPSDDDEGDAPAA